MIIIRSALLGMRNVTGKFVEKNKIHILYYIIFFGSRVVYEIMWKHMVERGRPQMAM
jgi:hypothetical protein